MQLKNVCYALGAIAAVARAQDDSITVTMTNVVTNTNTAVIPVVESTTVVTVTTSTTPGAIVITNEATSFSTSLIAVATTVPVVLTDLSTASLLPSLNTVMETAVASVVTYYSTFLVTTQTNSFRYDTMTDSTGGVVVATVTNTDTVLAGATVSPTTGAAAHATAMAGGAGLMLAAAAFMV